jgi:hypothetical protein
MNAEFKTICYPFLCLSHRTQAPLQPKRPRKVCGICCCREIRMYSNLRVWYCILCCECTHPNHERCCEWVKKLAGNEVSDVEMWRTVWVRDTRNLIGKEEHKLWRTRLHCGKWIRGWPLFGLNTSLEDKQWDKFGVVIGHHFHWIPTINPTYFHHFGKICVCL